MLSVSAIYASIRRHLASSGKAVELISHPFGLCLLGLQLRKLAFSPGSLNVLAVQP